MSEEEGAEAHEVYEDITQEIKALVALNLLKLKPEQTLRVRERLSDEFRFY